MRQGFIALALLLTLGADATVYLVTCPAGATACTRCGKECCCSLKGPAGRCGTVCPSAPRSTDQAMTSSLLDGVWLPSNLSTIASTAAADRSAPAEVVKLVSTPTEPPDPPPRDLP